MMTGVLHAVSFKSSGSECLYFSFFLLNSTKSIFAVILSVVTAVYFAGITRPISLFRLPITTASQIFC